MKPLALVVALSLALTSPALAAEASIPAGADGAKERLEKSPRHGEFVNIPRAGAEKPIRSYIVFPEKKEKAPVVIVIHEIFGLSDWVRGVADQLAADGFIAIAPDLLTTRNLPGAPADMPPDAARAAIGSLALAVYQRALTSEGVLLLHISNRYFELEPQLAAALRRSGWLARVLTDNPPARNDALTGSVWIAASRDPAQLARVVAGRKAWKPLLTRPGVAPWTDEHASILPALRWANVFGRPL